MHGTTRVLILGFSAGLMLTVLADPAKIGSRGDGIMSESPTKPNPDGPRLLQRLDSAFHQRPDRAAAQTAPVRAHPNPPRRPQPTDTQAGPSETGPRKAEANSKPGEAAWWQWPLLEPGPIQVNQATVRIEGEDPRAPQLLRLWHRSQWGPQLLAQTLSTQNGRFDFGFIVLPHSGLDLVVTPPSVDPRSVSPLHLERPVPAPPRVELDYSEHGLHARFTPVRLEGQIRILDKNGHPLAEQSVGAGPASLIFETGELQDSLHVTHVRADGSSSQPIEFHRPASP